MCLGGSGRPAEQSWDCCMIRLTDGMLLYHGSYIEVSEIDLSKCRPGLDFGRGFYVTSSLKQARAYVPSSVKKAQRRGWISRDFAAEQGVISVFEYHASPALFVHCFEEADAEWLHFAVCNRSERLFPELRRKYQTVDIIGGCVADDQTAVTLNSYVAGIFGTPGDPSTDRRTIELLEPERLQDQFCFRTDDAVHSLQFVRSINYGDSE